ncbi:glycosyltransferase family 2 protein [Protofrankia symbiont of Coriaria ruscifolia]|uniref:glycosyltransferase family 2 protein n=1 Tax=Protofrankia symbiont of Coriaria ruscifolia TaxID=1306542 RepID=UPI00104137E2|nr:glycosyltransferase family 2 protein [Protofrankia symbiont of Coriaria ruscifolia]
MTTTGSSPPHAGRPAAGGSSLKHVAGEHVTVEVVAIVVVSDRGRSAACRGHPGHALSDAVAGPGLTQTLSALDRQTRPPDQVVMVDVSGRPPARRVRIPDGPRLPVLTLPPGTGYGAAVAAGLAHRITGTPDFLWLLHHDWVPAPDTLERLLTYAALDPSATVLGPKVLDWADPKLLVEAGAGVDSAGHRVTGISPGEIDSGQHDAVRDVLAVSSAGALVRGQAWHLLGGFDPDLVTVADLDFCWRAWRAGMRVVVVPPAVIHVARTAGHPAPVRGQHDHGDCGHGGQADHRDLRREELQVRMANIGAGLLIPAWLWLMPAGLGRGAALAAGGRFRQGLDEVVAAAEVMGRPGWLWRARRRRAASARVPARTLRPLLAARGGPSGTARMLLHALSLFLSLFLRRGRSGPPASAARPALLLSGALAVVSLVAARFMLGAGWGPGTVACRIPGVAVSLPLPDGARDLWSAALSGWPGGFPASGLIGSGSPGSVASGPGGAAPLWLVPLAVLATALGGKPWLAADVVLLGGPALAGLAAYAASAHVGRGRGVSGSGGLRTPVRVVVAAGYALAPPMIWGVAAGRVDVVFALVMLPGVLTAAAVLVAQPDTGRATWPAVRRFAFRLLAAVACAPTLFLSAVVGLAVAVVLLRRPRRLVPVLAVAVAGTILLWPWHSAVLGWPWRHSAAVDALGALPAVGATGRAGMGTTAGALPGWLGPAMPAAELSAAGPTGGHVAGLAVAVLVPVALTGAVGAVRADTRKPVLAAWGVVVVGLAGAAVETHAGGAGRTGELAAAQLAVAIIGMLLACALSVTGARGALRRHPLGWRQVTALSLGGAVAAGPLAGALMVADAGEVAAGAAARAGGMAVSVLAVAQMSGQDARVLVLRQPSRDSPVGYTLTDARGPRLDATFAAMSASGGAAVGAVVADLVVGRAAAAGGLAALAVRAVVVPRAGASPLLVATLDSVPGLVREQVADDAVVWRCLPSGPAGLPGAVLPGAVLPGAGAPGAVPDAPGVAPARRAASGAAAGSPR